MRRIPLTHRQAARAGGWLSLVVIISHSIMIYLAFGAAPPRIPIDDPFVRWELLNIEFGFTVLVVVTACLAIHHARVDEPHDRTPRVATAALATLWTADTIYAVVAPMPMPPSRAWVHAVVPIMLGGIAAVCWFAVFTPSTAPAGARA
jgi:hypothetical protein